MKFFASCGKGLEYLLADELLALGCARATAAMAGVNVEGTLADAQRAVLWSRLASRVLWPLAEFDCADEHALYAGVAAMRLARASRRGRHAGRRRARFRRCDHARALCRAARQGRRRRRAARADRRAAGRRCRSARPAPEPGACARAARSCRSISAAARCIGAAGASAQGEAPLKENLAAAVLMRGGWPQHVSPKAARCSIRCAAAARC